MPGVNRNNLKQSPIPVVPRTLRLTNEDGTVTRSGQLLLEQLQVTGGPWIETFEFFDISPSDHPVSPAPPAVPIYQPGPGIRAIGVLRKAITSDLVISVTRNHEASPLFTFTIPKTTAVGVDVTLDISTIQFQDLDVLIAKIVSSDSSTDANGVATLTIEWGSTGEAIATTGRGAAGAPSPGPPPTTEAPPPVSIVSVTVTDNYDGTAAVSVEWRKAGNATADNFSGIELFLEDPDHSGAPSAPMDGSVTLNSIAALQGNWTTKAVSKYTGTPAVFSVDLQDQARQARVYAPSYNATHPAVPVRATDPNPSPNMAFTIPAAQFKYVVGMEFTWLCRNAKVTVVPDYNNPAGPQYGLDFFYDPPLPRPLPPGMKDFAGVHIEYLEPDATINTGGPDLWVNAPQDWHVRGYPVGATPAQIGVYFCSIDVAGRVNTPVDGVTPFVTFIIDLNPLPSVMNLVLSNPRSEYFVDGTVVARVDVSWSEPNDNRVAGYVIYKVDPTSPKEYGRTQPGTHNFTITENNWPTPAQDWTITVLTYGRDGLLSDDPRNPTHSPTAIWHIGPPTLGGPGVEYVLGMANISHTTITTDQQVNSDGIVMMRFKIGPWINPTDPNFAGISIARTLHGDLNNPVWWDAAKTDTSFTTPWEPATSATVWDFWFDSRDQQGHRNTLAPGLTPKIVVNFIPDSGHVIATRLPTGWWSTNEFQWPGAPANNGSFSVAQILAQKIWTGQQIVVGGGTGTAASSFAGNNNGQIAVMNISNQVVGWIGEQDGTGSGSEPAHSVFGGWFRELYVGGGGPPTAPLYCNSNGVLILGGFDVTTALATTVYPYLSVRDEFGVEKGRVGAHLAYGFPATDPYGAPTPQIAGAWFYELAIGGQSFTDWRILAQRPVNPNNLYEQNSIQIRNINNFFIEYNQTASNAPYRLKLGMDWFAGPAIGGRQFPGIEIQRISVTNGRGSGNETGHRSVLINRGLILESSDPTANKQRAFLVTFNGDQGGNDGGPFWGLFGLYDQRGNARVFLSAADNDWAIRVFNPNTAQDVIVADPVAGGFMAKFLYAGIPNQGVPWGQLRVGVPPQGELWLENGQTPGWTYLGYGGTNGAGLYFQNKTSGAYGARMAQDASGGWLTLHTNAGTQTIYANGANGIIAAGAIHLYNSSGSGILQISADGTSGVLALNNAAGTNLAVVNGSSGQIWCASTMEADGGFQVGTSVGISFNAILLAPDGSHWAMNYVKGILVSANPV